MKTFHAFVDRLEGDTAVLLIGKDESTAIAIPSHMLPDGAGEGSVLSVSIKFEPKLTEDSRSNVADVIKRMTSREQ